VTLDAGWIQELDSESERRDCREAEGKMNGNIQVIGAQQPAQGAMWKATRSAGLVIAGSAFVALCAHVSIPLWFTPVPVTLQPFAVVLLGLLLDPGVAVGVMIAYLAEGAAGLPVFTPHGVGGVAQLVGLTGGYLMSYPVVALLVSTLWRRGARSFSRGLLVAAAGDLLILTMGAAWMEMWTHISLGALMANAVVPFLPGDALKVCAAAGIASGFARVKRRA
jgi:biotin transport system substrate-specific component